MSELPFRDVLNLADYYLFDRLAEGKGDRPALRFGSIEWTYREVAAKSRAVCSALAAAGVCPEQRVYIVLPDAPPFVWSLFGTLARGAVVAMGNPQAKSRDLAYGLAYTRAAALITTPAVAQALADEIASSPHLRAIYTVAEVATGEDPEVLPAAVAGAMPLVEAMASPLLENSTTKTRPGDVACWLFTSGSTGRPKAAVHTHSDFVFSTEAYAKRTVGYRSGDVTVSVPRLFFGYATGTNLFFPFAMGATTALFSERPTAQRVAQAIAEYQPTLVTNVPTMMQKLLAYDRELRSQGQPGIDMSSIRCHLSAGEALPPSLLQDFRQRFGGEVYDGLGSAEMFHIYVSNRPGDVQPGSLGRAVAGYELKILSREAEQPGAAEVPVGEVGVLWVKGDSVAQGYFQEREASWRTFHGHWCQTGDLVRCDGQGYYWFAGRADDLFKVAGVWVAPLEVEDCLMRHPKVDLVAVIPVEREGLVKPRAYVVRTPDSASEEALAAMLREHCVNELSRHKCPREILFVEDLPKNDRGKVDKNQLKALASTS